MRSTLLWTWRMRVDVCTSAPHVAGVYTRGQTRLKVTPQYQAACLYHPTVDACLYGEAPNLC